MCCSWQQIAEEEVDCKGTEDPSMLDYPPHVLYRVQGSKHVKINQLRLEVVGLDKPVSFTIPLIPPSSDSSRTSPFRSDETIECKKACKNQKEESSDD